MPALIRPSLPPPLPHHSHQQLLLQTRSFSGAPFLPIASTPLPLSSNRASGGGVVVTRAQGLDLWELLGGRGLSGGEYNLQRWMNTTTTTTTSPAPPPPPDGDEPPRSTQPIDPATVGSFEKELLGLTGGFPGGETGVSDFLRKFPPPTTPSSPVDKVDRPMMPGGKPVAVPPPLLMPGMIVRVNKPGNPYHMYTGILQRVSDGRAGVLFEGGNWDKLVTFMLTDLERSASGPPMSNPKSAVLLLKETKT